MKGSTQSSVAPMCVSPQVSLKRMPYTAAAAIALLLAAGAASGQDAGTQPSPEDQAPLPRPIPDSSGIGEQGSGARGQSVGVEADCENLPGHEDLRQVLQEVVSPGDTDANGGLANNMWATVVDRSGAVCTVAYSGSSFGDQWPGSRGISAEKAYTANAFSLPGFALSTANLYWPSQPGNSLYGLISTTNPVVADALYQGPASAWGTENDPIVDQRIGGTVVFAGGLALYSSEGDLLGGIGLSGDQSCTDHIIAWKIRHHLNLDNVPAGVTGAGNDNIIFDLTEDPASGRQKSSSGYGHPTCGPTAKRIAENFSDKFPTGPDE